MSEDINVGAISEALNNKVDLNQMNTNVQGLSYGSGWGMPSNRYIDLTLGASGTTYTAPANGWFCIAKISGENNRYVAIRNTANNASMLAYAPYQGATCRAYVPAKRSQSVAVGYDTVGATVDFRFIYAEGEE